MMSSISLYFLSIFAITFLTAPFLRDKSKPIRNVLLCLGSLALMFFIGLWVTGLWSAPSSAQTTRDLSSLEMTASILNAGGAPTNSSPEIALERFWLASLSGNQKVVNDIAARPKGDWWNVCVDKGVPVKSDSEYELLLTENVRNGKFGGARTEAPEESFGGENVPSDLRTFARYIYASQVKLKRVEIVSNQSHEGEALLRVGVASYMGNAAKGEKFAVGFKKIGNEWKIIGIIQTGVLDFVDAQINYGRDSSICN